MKPKNYGWNWRARELVHQLDKTVCRLWAEAQSEPELLEGGQSQFATLPARLHDRIASVLVDLETAN